MQDRGMRLRVTHLLIQIKVGVLCPALLVTDKLNNIELVLIIVGRKLIPPGCLKHCINTAFVLF